MPRWRVRSTRKARAARASTATSAVTVNVRSPMSASSRWPYDPGMGTRRGRRERDAAFEDEVDRAVGRRLAERTRLVVVIGAPSG